MRNWGRTVRWTILSGMSLAVVGCGAFVDPPGEGARQIADVWWVMFWLGLIPLVIVVGLILSLTSKRERSVLDDRRMVVYGGVVLSSLLLAPVIVMTAATQLDLDLPGDERLEVQITGHQFWWDIQYLTEDGRVRTANELHIPVGIPVDLSLTSDDVIHSVWIPELAGKMDLVPGRVNELQIMANEEGVFEGRCAEFCGLGHANMQLIVVAHAPDAFDDWLEREGSPAEVDVETSTLQTFADGCGPCHTVRGLFDDPAYEGDFGPDLTHLASRRMLAANIIPNTDEFLARWIVDPKGVKPGTRMPDVGLDADELEVILDLLGQLD